MKTVELLQEGVIKPEDLKITFSEESNRFVDPELEEQAISEWKQIADKAKSDGLKVWDGVYYRLENIDEVRKGSLSLKLSTVKYSQIRAFQRLNVSKKYSPEFYTYHISTVGTVKTKDGYYVFGYREKSLNAFQTSFIGGGLQEDEIDVKSGEDIEGNMFKEMNEELGITKKSVESIKLTKILNNVERMNVFFIFEVELSILKDDVESSYDKLKDKEHDSLVFVSKSELKDYSKSLPEWMQIALPN